MTVGVNAVLINVTLIANIEGATIDVTIYLGVAANSEVLGNSGTTAYGQILDNIYIVTKPSSTFVEELTIKNGFAMDGEILVNLGASIDMSIFSDSNIATNSCVASGNKSTSISNALYIEVFIEPASPLTCKSLSTV